MKEAPQKRVRRGCLQDPPKGKLLEREWRDGTHCLMAFPGHSGSRSAMGSGDPVLEQSSKPAEVMTGKRKARKEEALPAPMPGGCST